MSCPCGVAAEQPWRTRDSLWSPASFVAGCVVIGVAVLALAAGVRSRFGWLLFGLIAASVFAAVIVQVTRRHRGLCLLRRGLWFGIAAPGTPVRLVFSLGW